jgi:hypothetical protein
MITAEVCALGLVTPWGRGAAALPAEPRSHEVFTVTPAPREGDRLRRATRECVLGVLAVDAMLEEGALGREAIAGDGTALVYVTAAAYGASNLAFVVGGGGALHFPYTAPSAVPAEVAIEFGLHGPYAVLIGGAVTTIDALTHAATLLARGACERALVLAVETFAECRELFARGGWAPNGPMIESAAAVLLKRAEGRGGAATPAAHGFAGTLACAPLVALARARAAGHETVELSGEWRGRRATIALA